MNRLANVDNKFQGRWKRVLCVCSAGLLRSPTAAEVLSSEPYNFNVRAAGTDVDFALIPVDNVLLAWADEIVCMDRNQVKCVKDMGFNKPIVCLDLDDCYSYRDRKLIRLIRKRYDERRIG